MELYIEIKDGMIHNHPIHSDNFNCIEYDSAHRTFAKYIKPNYSELLSNLKNGQYLQYGTDYNCDLQIVFEYAHIVGNHIPLPQDLLSI